MASINQGGRKGRNSKTAKNKKELLAAGVTFPTPVTALPGFLENPAYMPSTPDPASFGFNFNAFPPADANNMSFGMETSNMDNDNSQLRIPTFEETLKPVISAT